MAGQGFDFDAVIAGYKSEGRYRDYTHHNHAYWRWTHGSLALVRDSSIRFDPLQDYWHLSERRLLVAYFATKLTQSYAPADTLRNLAFRTFLHFQRAREDGRFGAPELATPTSGLWPSICEGIFKVARIQK